MGALDYICFPHRGRAWGGPFNGQVARQALFRALIDKARPAAILETGTYLGTTTEFMANFGLPVYSVEGQPRNYGFAKSRLRRHRNISLCLGDSRVFLSDLLGDYSEDVIFAYLDAHWNSDLPLVEEIEIIFCRRPRAVVMIDDFQVPDDADYGFDDYGTGKALTLDYVAGAVAIHGLCLFYPATPSAQETGARRGCVVVGKETVHGSMLSSVSQLRSAKLVLS
jgi:hypothetical protein